MKLVRKNVIKWKQEKQLHRLKIKIRQEIMREVQSICSNCLRFNEIENCTRKMIDRNTATRQKEGVWESVKILN